MEEKKPYPGLYAFDHPKFDELWKEKDIHNISIYKLECKQGDGLKKAVICRLLVTLHTFNNDKEAFDTVIQKAKEMRDSFNNGTVKPPLRQPTYRINGSKIKMHRTARIYPETGKYGFDFPEFEDAHLEDLEVFHVKIYRWYATKRNVLAKKTICYVKCSLSMFNDDKLAYDCTYKKAKEICDGFTNGTLNPNKQKTYSVPKDY